MINGRITATYPLVLALINGFCWGKFILTTTIRRLHILLEKIVIKMRKVSAFSCKTSEELLPSTLLLHSLAKFNATGEIYLNRVDGGRLLQLHFSTSYIIAAGYRVICLEQETEHLLTNDSLQLDYVATE